MGDLLVVIGRTRYPHPCNNARPQTRLDDWRDTSALTGTERLEAEDWANRCGNKQACCHFELVQWEMKTVWSSNQVVRLALLSIPRLASSAILVRVGESRFLVTTIDDVAIVDRRSSIVSRTSNGFPQDLY
jgi:hypothetical protein